MHVTVIDATGVPPQPAMTVVITGDRIAEIGRTQHVRVPDIALFVRFKHHQTWQYPTLTVLRSSAFLDDSTFRNDPRLKYMPVYIRTQWESTTDFHFQARTEDDV